MRAIRHRKRAGPFIAYDLAVADREARQRHVSEHVDHFLGVRVSAPPNRRTEFIVARIDDFGTLHAEGGWLLHRYYGAPMQASEFSAACVHGQLHEAVIDATTRMTQGAAPVFMARREGDFLVAALTDWPRFARVEWMWIDSFGA